MKKFEIFDRKIPTKNYLVVFVVSILVIIFTLYFRAFYLSYQVYKQSDSYFSYMKVNEVTKKDFDFILSETTSNILYIGYGSNKLYSLEKKLYREIEKSNMLDRLIYWNVTEYMEEGEYLQILKEKFNNVIIYEAPSIIIIENGNATGSYMVNDDLFRSKILRELLERESE